MNLINYFKTLTQKYNDIEKCGFCWTFKNVHKEDGMNDIRLTDEEKCCMNIILTDEQKIYSEKYNVATGTVTDEFCENRFTLYIVKTSNLGTNFGNEIPNHNESESIMETIINPLFDCFIISNKDICSLGYDFAITQWALSRVLFIGDQNFSGIKIQGAFRERIN